MLTVCSAGEWEGEEGRCPQRAGSDRQFRVGSICALEGALPSLPTWAAGRGQGKLPGEVGPGVGPEEQRGAREGAGRIGERKQQSRPAGSPRAGHRQSAGQIKPSCPVWVGTLARKNGGGRFAEPGAGKSVEQPAGASGAKGGGPELRGWAVEERGRWERLLFGACEQVEGGAFHVPARDRAGCAPSPETDRLKLHLVPDQGSLGF